MNNTDSTHRKAIIGNPNSSSFWLYDSTKGFDLTHPPTPTSPTPSPSVTVQTTTVPVTIDPRKSALVVVDMQNFFLSPLLGRPDDSNGLLAQGQLLQHAIPAARKAGIRIIWLNWGLTESEIEAMPPATLRAFGFETVEASQFESYTTVQGKQAAIDSHGVNEGCDRIVTQMESSGKNPRIYKGLGTDIGPVILDDGSSTVPGGRLLMRDTWNADLTPELRKEYEAGLTATPPDVWIHKNRMSGLWGSSTLCTEFLEEHGIKTLLFTGVNTDQCVGGSLQDVSHDPVILLLSLLLPSLCCGHTSQISITDLDKPAPNRHSPRAMTVFCSAMEPEPRVQAAVKKASNSTARKHGDFAPLARILRQLRRPCSFHFSPNNSVAFISHHNDL